MDIEEIGAKEKDLFSRGTKASKEAFEKAGDKVQDFTDKSLTKIETLINGVYAALRVYHYNRAYIYSQNVLYCPLAFSNGFILSKDHVWHILHYRLLRSTLLH